MTQEKHDEVGKVSADPGEHDCTNPLVLSHSRLAHLERRVVCSGTPQVLRGGINNPVSASWCGVNGKATPPSRLTGNRRNRRDGGSRGSVTPTYRTPVARSRAYLPSLSLWIFIIFFPTVYVSPDKINETNGPCTRVHGTPRMVLLPHPLPLFPTCVRDTATGVSISELSNSS